MWKLDPHQEEATLVESIGFPFVLRNDAMTKESINRSYEVTLNEGIRFERRLFHSLFATEDQDEGMQAFIDKRSAQFKNR